MFRRALFIILALLTLGGCKGAKSLLADTRSGGGGKADISPGGQVEDSLNALVIREGDGVKFRRDLPFPTRLEVRMVHQLDYRNVRIVERSALGKSSKGLNQRTETEVFCGKNPGIFELKLEKAGRRMLAEGEDPTQILDEEPGWAVGLEGTSLQFALSEGGWRARYDAGAVDFKKAVWADSLEGSVPQLMVETGGHPRVQWFSSSRVWRPGDQITLTGNTLKILDPFDVSGRVRLKFEGVEAVGGHPCGVFSVTGDMRVDDQLQVDGSHHDLDISVTSGKVWASLLHPVLLREEYETVQTMVQRQGKPGGPETSLQGAVGVMKSRNWMPIAE